MKVFAFIMAMLVLVLSCIPCSDGPFAHGNDKAKVETIKESHEQDAPDHTDACSPFCNCACCASYSANYYSNFVMQHYIASSAVASFLPADLIEVSLPVWQPPQLS